MTVKDFKHKYSVDLFLMYNNGVDTSWMSGTLGNGTTVDLLYSMLVVFVLEKLFFLLIKGFN